jgi:hypothetical protein
MKFQLLLVLGTPHRRYRRRTHRRQWCRPNCRRCLAPATVARMVDVTLNLPPPLSQALDVFDDDARTVVPNDTMHLHHCNQTPCDFHKQMGSRKAHSLGHLAAD